MRIWVDLMGERLWWVEESGRFAIPHPLQRAQRVGHPELWSPRENVVLRTPHTRIMLG